MLITETFLSIQGEGLQAGLPTYFIRLSGCNLDCSYCDTKYAHKKGYYESVNELISRIEKVK